MDAQTTNLRTRLDDAAAGVLFGDSEANMQEMITTAPFVLHSIARVGSELERLGRLACGSKGGAGRAGAAGGGKRGGGMRREQPPPVDLQVDPDGSNPTFFRR